MCKKSRTETVSEFIDRLTTLKQELIGAGSQVSDPNFIIALMMGTHEEFGDYVSAITAKTTTVHSGHNDSGYYEFRIIANELKVPIFASSKSMVKIMSYYDLLLKLNRILRIGIQTPL